LGVAVYDDRLEVTSSGTLHFGLTPEKLLAQHESLPWNPLIAGVFYRRGLIEEWGRGTIKMMELTTSAGLPPLEIEDTGGCVTVRFPRSLARAASDHVTEPRQLEILSLLEMANEALALRDIQTRLRAKIDIRVLSRDMASLKALGLVEVNGHGRVARWKLSQ